MAAIVEGPHFIIGEGAVKEADVVEAAAPTAIISNFADAQIPVGDVWRITVFRNLLAIDVQVAVCAVPGVGGVGPGVKWYGIAPNMTSRATEHYQLFGASLYGKAGRIAQGDKGIYGPGRSFRVVVLNPSRQGEIPVYGRQGQADLVAPVKLGGAAEMAWYAGEGASIRAGGTRTVLLPFIPPSGGDSGDVFKSQVAVLVGRVVQGEMHDLALWRGFLVEGSAAGEGDKGEFHLRYAGKLGLSQAANIPGVQVASVNLDLVQQAVEILSQDDIQGCVSGIGLAGRADLHAVAIQE